MANTRVFPNILAYLAPALGNRDDADRRQGRGSTVSIRRIEHKLRCFEERNVPCWIAKAPTQSNLYHLLAGVEGPPDTAFERGGFWLALRLSRDYPWSPPKIRFLTRVYHPNIDGRGKICMDTLEKAWSAFMTLGFVLVGICSLSSDPLVPKIAQTYCEDYELYCQSARPLTVRHASTEPGSEMVTRAQ